MFIAVAELELLQSKILGEDIIKICLLLQPRRDLEKPLS